MKRIAIIITIFSLGWISCGQGDTKPTTYEAANKLLNQKKKNLRDLKAEIKDLTFLSDSLNPNPTIEKVTTITVDTISYSVFKHFEEVQGTLQADDMIKASGEIGGRLLNLNFKEGQNINKGQLIATIDTESIDKQIAELEKALELAQDLYERQERLWKKNIGSEIQYLQAKNSKERLEKSLESARLNITKANVYAPTTGVVDRVITHAGEIVGPGTPILTILNTRKIKMAAAIPEKFLKSVKRGQKVEVKIPTLEETIPSRISLVGRSINPANRTFNVEIPLSNKSGYLKPNLLSILYLNDYTDEKALTIDVELVQQEVSGKEFLMVAQKVADGYVAHKVYVKSGVGYQNKIQILEGLKAGDIIISKGARNVAEGDKITF